MPSERLLPDAPKYSEYRRKMVGGLFENVDTSKVLLNKGHWKRR